MRLPSYVSPMAIAVRVCFETISAAMRSCSSGWVQRCTASFLIPRPVMTCCATSHARHADWLPQLWEGTGRPCSEATVDDALACMDSRRRAHDDRLAVLVHGDVHDMNALQAADGTFKLIDPGGLRAEPACDLGTIVRCNPDCGDDLRVRTERLAARTGVDATAIWEWGTIYRVTSGLYCRSIGFQPFGDLLLAEADRLSG
jgi:streptomycin 6-kinase